MYKNVHRTNKKVSPLLLLPFCLCMVIDMKSQKSYIPGVISGLPASLGPSNARILNADFDGDGDQDLLFQQGNVSGTGIHYLKNNNNSSFTDYTAVGGVFPAGTPFGSLSFTRIMNPDRAATGQAFGQRVLDYDGDGDQDVLEVSTTSAPRLLLQNAGVFSLGTVSPAFPALMTSSVSRWVSGDFDSDGDTDILLQQGNTSQNGISFLRNDESGVWTAFAANASGVFSGGPLNGNSFTRIGNNTNFFHLVFDADHDGDQDFYELSATGHRYFTSNGSQLSLATIPTGLPTTLSPAVFRMIAADFDHEGDIDILYQTSNAPGTNITFLKNNRDGTFTVTNATGGLFSGPNTPFGAATFSLVSRAGLNGEQIIMDLDGDNDMDILQLSTTASSVLLQTGFNLPVKLESYTVSKAGTSVQVAWKTSEEVNASHFMVEYSISGSHFMPLQQVASKSGARGGNYTYIHRTPRKGTQYYRLVQYDLDGRTTAYSIRSVHFDGSTMPVRITPNTAKDKITAYIALGEFRQVQMLDNTGRVLQTILINHQGSSVEINIARYSAGLYYLRFAGATSTHTERIIKE
jgi:hypothetical protein